jgi:hypothetical protein
VYVLKHVVHDWDDAAAAKILANVRRAMKPAAKVVLVEMVVEDGPDGLPAKVLDLDMLVLLTGRERTEAEFAALLAQAGLRLTRSARTLVSSWVIEAESE